MDKAALLKEILAANPADAFARYGLAMEYANRGETEPALTEFDRLLADHPNYTAGYFMKAQSLVKAGRRDDAKHTLETGVSCAQRAGDHHAKSEMQGLLEELQSGEIL